VHSGRIYPEEQARIDFARQLLESPAAEADAVCNPPPDEPPWGDQCYIIAAKRGDGGLPKMCKAMYDKLYFDFDEPQKLCDRWNAKRETKLGIAVYEIRALVLREYAEVANQRL
jgi:hypothetical protein